MCVCVCVVDEKVDDGNRNTVFLCGRIHRHLIPRNTMDLFKSFFPKLDFPFEMRECESEPQTVVLRSHAEPRFVSNRIPQSGLALTG